MKKVRSLFLLTILLSLFASCAPLLFPADDYPAPYDGIEWVEITKDEAKQLFDGYSHKKLYKKASLYECITYNDNSVIKYCTVEGDSYYKYSLDAHTYGIDHLTVNPEDWDDLEYTPSFHKAKNNSNLVKISHSEQYNDYYRIYEKGWLRENVWITNGPKNHSYSKEYVDYK